MKEYFVSFILLCFGFVLAADPASATILFAGGEDVDFVGIGSPLGVTTGGCYNSTYVREAVYTTNVQGPYYVATPVFTSASTFWVHFDFASCNTNGANNNYPWVQLNDSSSVPRLYFAFNGGFPSTITLYKENAAHSTTLLVTSTNQVFWNSNSSIDIYINYSTTGTVTFYQNGTQVLTYSGDVTTDGNTSLAQLQLGSQTGGNPPFYSQVIISTTDSRLMHLATMTPVANGNTMAWTGSVSSINATSYNDANFITSATSGQIGEFTLSALPSGNFSVVALIQSARAEATSGGPQNLKFDVRTSGTDYQSANQTLTTAFGLYQYIWATNPNTSVAWTTSDLGAAGFNDGVESQT